MTAWMMAKDILLSAFGGWGCGGGRTRPPRPRGTCAGRPLNFGDTPPGPRLHSPPDFERPAIETFYELDARILQQRAQDAVDKSRVHVDDVGVDPGQNVPP